MNIKKSTIIVWILEIVLLMALSFMYYLNQKVVTSKVLHIPQGSIGKIIAHLGKRNEAVYTFDKYILSFIGLPQSGWIQLGTTELTKADFLYKITTSKAALKEVTLIPGETTFVFFNQLSEELNLDTKKLRHYLNKYSTLKEGAFVPETYSLPTGIDEKETILILLNFANKKFKQYSSKIFGTYNEKKWFHYVTLASVIQKEAASVDDMKMVASVVQNRLKKGMKLQMDGSLNYGKYSHTKVTARRIREDKTHFNTYKYKGIPDYPVCNVSFDAIKAAIFPAKSEYLYFVKNKKGGHSYARYYSTHVKNIHNGKK